MFTNTTAVDAYRGAGRPEACYVLERMVDAGGRRAQDGPGRAPPEELHPASSPAPSRRWWRWPTTAATTARRSIALLQMFDYKKFRAEQAEARGKGRYIGIGFSTYIEACSIAPSKVVGALGAGAGLYESGKVRVHPTGSVTVYTGSHSHGQGHETTFAQLVADELQIPIEQVEVDPRRHGRDPVRDGHLRQPLRLGRRHRAPHVGQQGQGEGQEDRRPPPRGVGRATSSTRAASSRCAGAPGKAVPFGAVALTAYVPHNYPEGLEPGLEETSFYDPSNFCFPFGAHACVVEVDRRHRPGEDPALPRGGRRRQRDQSDDRRRHGPRRHRAGRRRRPCGRARSTTASRASS